MFKDHVYKISGFLILGFVCIGFFQNCGSQNADPDVNQLSSVGDKAIFELHGIAPTQVQSILWEVLLKTRITDNIEKSVYIRKDTSNLKIGWDELVNENEATDQIGAFVALSEQNCITYRPYGSFLGRPNVPNVSEPDLPNVSEGNPGNPGPNTIPTSTTTSSTKTDKIQTSITDPPKPRLEIEATSSKDPNAFKDYFPSGSAVNFTSRLHSYSYTETTLNNFQWSVKQIFETKNDVSVANNTKETLSHIFNGRGLYEVSVTATDSEGSSLSGTKQILIDFCEGEQEPIEIVLNANSIGESTPEKIKAIPFFNYFRPDDSNSEYPIKLVADHFTGKSVIMPCPTSASPDNGTSSTCNEEATYSSFYVYGSYYYKYHRKSPTKSIAIDALNLDKCFFDDNPNEETSQICTLRGCPEDDPDCNTCWDRTEYTLRSDLQPLDSCRGTAYDMGEIDTDTTQCTEDIFVLGLAFKPAFTGLNNSNRGNVPFYKYCPSDSEFCYFGLLRVRPDEHYCPEDADTS